jgi:hypothetical protein
VAEGRDGGLAASGRIGRVGPLVSAARSGATGVSKEFHGSRPVNSAVTSTRRFATVAQRLLGTPSSPLQREFSPECKRQEGAMEEQQWQMKAPRPPTHSLSIVPTVSTLLLLSELTSKLDME